MFCDVAGRYLLRSWITLRPPKHFIFSMVVERRWGASWRWRGDWFPGHSAWSPDNMESGPTCFGCPPIQQKAEQKECLLNSSGCWSLERALEIKEKSPSSRFWISRLFSKGIFSSRLLWAAILICKPTEWDKNAIWSHTNIGFSEHWWHSTTKENQGGRDFKMTLVTKGTSVVKHISGNGITQWANCG